MPRKKVELTLAFTTPLVMAGVETKDPEPRLPSLRGLLRWWYRIGSDCDRKGESRLFGAVGQDGTRAGLLRLRWAEPLSTSPSSVLSYPSYLGFSLRWRKKGHAVQGFQPPSQWKIRIDFEPWAGDDDVHRFLAAAWLCFTLGCAGFRARRGFGAWKVVSTNVSEFLSFTCSGNSADDLAQFICNNLSRIHKNLSWPLPFWVWVCNLSWEDLGNQYRTYRQTIQPRRNRAVWGLPIQGVSDDRFASPVWFKPWSPDGPCLITSIRPWLDQFEWPDHVDKQHAHLIDGFIDDLRSKNFYSTTVWNQGVVS